MLRAGRRHPLDGATSSLFGGGVTRLLAAHIKALKIPLHLLLLLLILLLFHLRLLLDYPVASPPPLHQWRCCPDRPLTFNRVRVNSIESSMAASFHPGRAAATTSSSDHPSFPWTKGWGSAATGLSPPSLLLRCHPTIRTRTITPPPPPLPSPL